MSRTEAVLFDFGGTLYDYRDLRRGGQESLEAFVGWHGQAAEPRDVEAAYRQALRKVFWDYLPRRFYYHRDMFRDALVEMARELGFDVEDALVDRYRRLQWELQERDFRLRAGVLRTLEALRDRGLHVGMVSNIDQDHLEHLVQVAGIEEHFDSLLSSEAVRSCKPDQRFFRRALQRAGCEAAAALFVGDSLPQDIAGANQAGMRSVLIWSRDDREPPETEHRPRHVIREIPELLPLVE